MSLGPIVKTWDEWASVFNDLEIWRPLIHEILSRKGILYDTIDIGYPGTSAVFIIDRNYVLKIYPSSFINDHKREWPVLSLLENLDNRPLLIASGVFEDNIMAWPYAIIRFIEGIAYRELAGQLNEHEKSKFLIQLAKKLQMIHRLPYDQLQANLSCQWHISKRDIQTKIDSLCNLSFFSDACFRVDLNNFIKRELAQLQNQKKVFVHGDLTEDHLFFIKENGEWTFTDIIDWGDAHIAPAVYDFVVLWGGILANQPKEWHSFVRLYGNGFDSANPKFQRLFTSMLFLHPFSSEIIANAYECRLSHHQPKYFQSVDAFIKWVVIPD